MRRLWSIAAVLVAVLAAGFLALELSSTVQDLVVRRIVAERVGKTRYDLLSRDALRVVLCGTGSPLPDPDHTQACTAIFAGGRMLLVDAGGGTAERLQEFNLPQGNLDTVLLTHFHSDHITGLPDVVLQSWAAGRKAPLRVIGGPGVDEVTRGFAAAMRQDATYRTAHHGPEEMPRTGAEMQAKRIDLPRDGDGAVVFEEDGVRFTVFRVNHPPVDPAYGYRIDWADRSVVVSGDTTPCTTLTAAARDADVLVHEALAPHLFMPVIERLEAVGDGQRARILRDVPDYHTTAVEAARQANEANVGLLVLSHLIPPPNGRIAERIFLRGVSAVRPKGVQIARDGMLLELPRGTKDVRTLTLD